MNSSPKTYNFRWSNFICNLTTVALLSFSFWTYPAQIQSESQDIQQANLEESLNFN